MIKSLPKTIITKSFPLPKKMKAIRLSPAPPGQQSYSPTNPAPSSALTLNSNLPIPSPSKPGDLLVRIRASTVIRDNLTWPELYSSSSPSHLGNDFSGTITSVFSQDSASSSSQGLSVGDEIYGMTHAARGGTWAEYAIVHADEAALKPARLSWEEAAALPLSALTADQALFEHAALPKEVRGGEEKKRVLITGAAGGVGRFLVQFAAQAGHGVVGASSSRERNGEYLAGLGAEEVVEYENMEEGGEVDVVVDCVGGKVLEKCWKVVKDGGVLISIESGSYDFIKEHREKGVAEGKENVKGVWFIVEPSREGLTRVAEAVTRSGNEGGLVSRVFPIEEAREAYELCHSGSTGRGKIVIKI